MPLNKSAAIRYRVIDRCLTNKSRRPDKEYIRRKCSETIGGDVTISTIEKDMQAMKHDKGLGFYAPIKYNKQDNYYYYATPDYTINELPLSEEEWNSLRIASGMLFQYKEIPVFNLFKQAIEHINSRFSLSLDMLDPFLEQYVLFEKRFANGGQKWLTQVYKSILTKNMVKFVYQNIYSGEEKEYCIEPYLLKENKNNWYLIGWSPEKQDYRTFSLDRIKGLEDTYIEFIRKGSFNADSYFSNSIGIMVGSNEPVKVVIEVFEPFTKMVESNPLHSSQSIIEKTDEFIRVEINVINSIEFQLKILSYGEYAKIIYPVSLKEQLKERLLEMISFY